MPTIPSIRTSVENKNVLILDEHAKNGTFRRDAKGRLVAYAGGFSVVFPYESSDGTMWAFRCWHSDINNSQRRYEIISEAIKKAQLDFLCGFEYTEKGINVEGNIYPTTRMRWIDGITIKDYICQNKDSKNLLLDLAENFLKMISALHKQSLAHGDLQHGNILVDTNHRLFLVDYDSFYCPQLKGEEDTVTGLPDYQHPARIKNKIISEKLDYFSELVIYLSILAIAEAPSLIVKYKVDDADRLLFSKEDYCDLEHSEIFNDINNLGGEFKEMLDILTKYLSAQSIDELQPFDELLVENKIRFSSSVSKAVRNKQSVVLSWSVPFEASVHLKQEGKGEKEVESKGKITAVLPEDSAFTLIVEKPDGRIVQKQLVINVFDECKIDFSADKYNIFPTIPVTLKWKVKNAKTVWLDKEEVEAVGSKVIEPEKAVSVVLSAEDEFGKKEQRIDIGMLPLPQVKSLLVPAPNLVHNMLVTVKQPRFNVDVKIPTIDIDWVRAEVPRVKSLKELGLNVELSPPLPRQNFMKSIKDIFNHIIRK